MDKIDPIEGQIKTFLSCYGKDTLRNDASFGSFRMGLYRHKGKANVLFYGKNMAYKLVCDPESVIKETLLKYRTFKRQYEQLKGIGFHVFKNDFFSIGYGFERKDSYYIWAFREMVVDRSHFNKDYNFVKIYDSGRNSMDVETDDMVKAVHDFLKRLPLDKTMSFPERMRDFIAKGN